jgi:hypothetical protein
MYLPCKKFTKDYDVKKIPAGSQVTMTDELRVTRAIQGLEPKKQTYEDREINV